MKYIFCIIALLAQPISVWCVYHKQNADKAALKIPMLYYSGIYLIAQFYVFIKFCLKIPEEYQIYSYLIQSAVLIVFLMVEFTLFGSNKYIVDIQNREQASIKDFRMLIQELEVCRTSVSDAEKQKRLDELLEKMRYSDPVSFQLVSQENQKIQDLIAEVSEITERALFSQKCDEITRLLEIRQIKNVKE